MLESVQCKLGGAWVFKGTRVPVSVVLSNIGKMSVAEIAEDFPSLRRDQITGLLDLIAHCVEPRP